MAVFIEDPGTGLRENEVVPCVVPYDRAAMKPVVRSKHLHRIAGGRVQRSKNRKIPGGMPDQKRGKKKFQKSGKIKKDVL